MTLRARRPAPATLIALLALFVALGGPAEARRLIDGKLIKKGTVRSKQVKDRSLTTRDLSRSAVATLTRTAAGSIGPAQLAFGAVTGDRIATGAVTAPALAPASVGTGAVADGSLTTADLANNAVTRSKVAQGAVGASEIVENAIDSGEVADGGLNARDVSTFAGRVTVDVAPIALEPCASSDHEVAPVRPNASLAGTAIVVTPPPAWPDDLVLQARGVERSQTSEILRVTVCDPGGEALPDLPPHSVAYAALAVD